ncbi:MAG: hypothetical protein PF495_16580 [Spirochaetales bacterium]|nr:hypothetical protein [Spirochaetales bacterium]
MESLDQKRKQVAAEIDSLSRLVEEMDGKIRAYLADRQNRPHPRHLDLIEKIQGYRIDPGITTQHLTTMVDNLQWKVYYSKRAWKQLWENAEAMRRTQMPNAPSFVEGAGSRDSSEDKSQAKAQYSVDTLWEIQKEKLRVYGSPETRESKSDFKKRMIQEYKKLSQHKKKGQEIVLTFDKESKHCKLDFIK